MIKTDSMAMISGLQIISARKIDMQNMMEQNLLFASIASGGDTAWAIGVNTNGLFQLSWEDGEYELLTCFPDGNGFFAYVISDKCHKYKNNIFCFPCRGDMIWVYDLSNRKLDKIPIEYGKGREIGISMVVEDSDILFAVANGLNMILEIDAEKKTVLNNFEIISGENQINTSVAGVVVNKKWYFIVTDKNRVCEFDLKTKNIHLYSIEKDKGINTISYDGKFFWLSGKTKEIFRWNKDNDEIYVVSDFPTDFGRYEVDEKDNFFICYKEKYSQPIFRNSICMGNAIWFIPHETNQIIYIDKDTCKLNSFLIEEEEENDSTWQRESKTKYRLEYIQKDQYIFLYSYKNKCYLKIDTVKFTIDYINLQMTERSMHALIDRVFEVQDIFYENRTQMQLADFIKSSFSRNKVGNSTNNGKAIYQFIS